MKQRLDAQAEYLERERRKQNRIKHKKLLFAVKRGNLVIVQNSGFVYDPEDVNIRDELGNCPIFYAARSNDARFVRWLLE